MKDALSPARFLSASKQSRKTDVLHLLFFIKYGVLMASVVVDTEPRTLATRNLEQRHETSNSRDCTYGNIAENTLEPDNSEELTGRITQAASVLDVWYCKKNGVHIFKTRKRTYGFRETISQRS